MNYGTKKPLFRIAVVGLFALLGASPLAAGPNDITAIVGVNVIPMDINRVAKNQTVIVKGWKIEAIGPVAEITVPAEAARIDGRDRYLIPGLAEMHAHIPSSGQGEEYRDRVLFLYVANGITTARGMLGEQSHLRLRRQLYTHLVLGPRLITSGPSFNGNSVTSAEQAVRRVREQKAAGYDFIKLHPGLTRKEFDAIAATADAVGLPFAGHVSAAVSLDRALEVRQATIDHLDGYMQAIVRDDVDIADYSTGFFGAGLAEVVDEAKIAEVARATAASGVWNVPTQTLIEHNALPIDPEEMAAWPEMQYMPANMVDDWVARKKRNMADPEYDPERAIRYVEIRRSLIKALHDAGAGLLLGSDAPQVFNVPGFAAHRELAILVESGLSPFQALRAGTINPAVYFGREQEFGTIEVGKMADFVLLNANPLDDIRNTQKIEAVMVRGKYLSRGDIDEGLAELSATR